MVKNTKVDKASVAAPVAVAPVAVTPVAVETKTKATKAKAAKTPKVEAAAPVVEPVVEQVAKPVEQTAEEPAVVSSETLLAEINAKVQENAANNAALKAAVKELTKVIAREKKAAEKSSKSKAAKKVNKDRKPSGFTKPTLISNELAKFLGKDAGTEMSRTAAAKEVIAYIKANNLTDKNNGRIILPDAALSSLLKVTSADKVHYFNLQTFMKPHFIKTTTTTA